MPNNTVDVTEGPHVVMEKVDKRDATFLKNHCCFLPLMLCFTLYLDHGL